METVILLLMLLLSDKKDDMKESLNRFLTFYKENRELIKMIAGALSRPNGESDGTEEKHEESRLHEEVGNLDVLEEYLRRANA